jgi:hypothetical protein
LSTTTACKRVEPCRVELRMIPGKATPFTTSKHHYWTGRTLPMTGRVVRLSTKSSGHIGLKVKLFFFFFFFFFWATAASKSSRRVLLGMCAQITALDHMRVDVCEHEDRMFNLRPTCHSRKSSSYGELLGGCTAWVSTFLYERRFWYGQCARKRIVCKMSNIQ